MFSLAEKRFIKFNLYSIIALFVVILAGGVVRSTGSGMGCPDWPKCFDRYIPPTNASQLPADYKEKYVARRVAKNEHFAGLLEKMGKKPMADSIRHDQSILVPEEFNAAKTWTEYINRLAGATAGIFMLLTVVFSFTYRKIAKRIVVLSILNIFVVGYQAWLGSIVVSTNLMPWIVTAHMLLALVLIAISIYTYFYAKQLHEGQHSDPAAKFSVKLLLAFAVILSVVQVTLGTEVRESIDLIASNLSNQYRNTWVSKIGDTLSYHRDLAMMVLLLNGYLFFVIKKRFTQLTVAKRMMGNIMLILIIQLVSGVVLSRLSLPPFMQTVHILFATLLFGAQFYLLLMINNNKKTTA